MIGKSGCFVIPEQDTIYVNRRCSLIRNLLVYK